MEAMGKTDAVYTLPKHPSGSCKVIPALLPPHQVAFPHLFFTEVFPPYRTQFRKPSFSKGADDSLLGEKGKVSNLPYPLSPSPIPSFQGS